MKKTTSKLIFKRSDYENSNALYEAMSKQLGMLLSNNYMASTYRSFVDKNIYVIEFSPSDMHLCDLIPVWVTTTQALELSNIDDDVDFDDDAMDMIDVKRKYGSGGTDA